jgi:hypothetical protein
VRASLFHLAAGFTFGALILANKGLAFEPALWRLLPSHVELLAFGWLGQLAMAVGYWILPRFSGSRGNTSLAWASMIALNVGVLISAASPLPGLPFWVAACGPAAIALAVAAFAWHAWPRIKAPGA